MFDYMLDCYHGCDDSLTLPLVDVPAHLVYGLVTTSMLHLQKSLYPRKYFNDKKYYFYASYKNGVYIQYQTNDDTLLVWLIGGFHCFGPKNGHHWE